MSNRPEAVKITLPQQRLLEQARKPGGVRQNGRARKTVEALERAGLVTYEYDLIPSAIGKWTEVFIVKAVEAPTTAAVILKGKAS